MPSSLCDYNFRHEPYLDAALNRKIHSTESVQDLLAPLPPTAPLMQQDQPENLEIVNSNLVLPSKENFVPFQSEKLQSGAATGNRGHFYSPQYPSTYPKNIKCQYHFYAQPNERVRVLLVDVSLQRIDQRYVSICIVYIIICCKNV